MRLVVPGHAPRKDAWVRNVAGRGRALTADAKDWISRLDFAWLQSRQTAIISGAWSMRIDIFVAQRRHLGDEMFPYRDCDSAVSPVLDALQRVGALDDDVRVAPITLDRHWDRAYPRTEIVLSQRLDDG